MRKQKKGQKRPFFKNAKGNNHKSSFPSGGGDIEEIIRKNTKEKIEGVCFATNPSHGYNKEERGLRPPTDMEYLQERLEAQRQQDHYYQAERRLNEDQNQPGTERKRVPNKSLSLTGPIMNFKFEGRPEKSWVKIEALSSNDDVSVNLRVDSDFENHVSSVSRINSNVQNESEVSVFDEKKKS